MTWNCAFRNCALGRSSRHRWSGAGGWTKRCSRWMEAYLHGVSTRKVDDLVQALGMQSGVSKSEVSRICADLDEEVAAFRDRSLAGTTYP